MAIIPVPSNFSFTSIPDFRLQRASNILRSKYTGQGQVVSFPYAVWFLKGKLVDYDGLTAGKIRSFLAQLDGQANTFRLPVPGFTRPMKGYAGNALANGVAAARASSMAIDGLPVSTALFSEGDYFTVNDELKMITLDVSSNGAGQATISFKPALRKPVADNTVITFQNPTILMRALDDDVAKWGIGAPTRQSTSFEAVEAVDI